MKKRILQMKWTKRIVLIVMLFGVAGLGKMYAQNLIVNSDFESGNTGFITDYSYTATGVVGEGHYCIDVTASGHGGGMGGWPNILGYGGLGKYMLVDGFGGATNPTKIVWKQTVNVTANTDYIFSCQVVNLAQSFFGYSPNPAILRLKINGSNVGSDWTIAQNNEWHEWSNTWSSGSATQATIEIYDIYTGNSGLGDDFGLDHFQLTPQATYSVNAVDDDASVCLYNSVQIDILANDIITPSGQQAGATVQIIQNPQHGTAILNNNTRKIQYMFTDTSYSGDLDQFKYRVTIPHGEMSEAWVYVTTSKQPSVGWINPPATICAGDHLGITVPTVEPAQGTGQWEYSPTQNGTYSPIPDPNNVPFSMNSNWVRYSVTNDCGESHSNSVQITVKDVPSIDTIQAPLAINAGGSFNLTQPTLQPNGSPIFNQGWQIAATQNGSYTPFNNNNVPHSYNGYWIRYFADNDCGVGYSNAVQITVYQDDNNIVFADANVKAICVANWDTNGDGELSYDEAAAVTDLGQVFRGNTTITSFEELQYFTGLTDINSYTFYWCRSLSSVVIPNSVTTIAQYAFFICDGLISVVIPNSVTYIGTYAFGYCNLASITIPNSVVYIGEGAFCDCRSLTSIAIPSSVTHMGSNPFIECSGLEQIIVDPENPVYDSRNNCNAIIKTNTNALITGCKNTIIPNTVTIIDQWAFSYCSGLTEITIPNSVLYIVGAAFYGCTALNEITIPNSVFYIGEHAFYGCIGLTSIEIPNSVVYIEANPFGGCTSLEQIIVDSGNAVFDSREDCNAIITTNTNVLVTGCTTTVIPSSVTSIGNYAFSGFNNLTSIAFPNALISIGEGAFRDCSGLTGNLTIPNSVTTIGSYAFYGCSGLTGSLAIPNSVTTIGESAFHGCSGLTGSLTIGNSVTSIGNHAFFNCRGFTTIISLAETPPSLGNDVFLNWSRNIPILVSCGFEEAYSSLSWGGFNHFIGLCSGMVTVAAVPEQGGIVTGGGSIEGGSMCTVTATANEGYTFVKWMRNGAIVSSNAEYTFYVTGDMALVAYFIPDGNIVFADANVKAICVANWDTNGDGELSYAEAAAVTNLGEVFRENTEITSFEELQYFIGLTSISSNAFYGCSNLSGSLYIPNSVTTIGYGAFYGCSGFTGSLTIPNFVTEIRNYAFYGCSGFTGSLFIPNSVTTIGSSAFSNCYNFDSIVVESGNTVYDSRESCNALIKTSTNELILGCKNSIIPNSVASIGNSAFYNCSGLTGSLTIPNSVTEIGDWAFYNCSGFTGSLTIGNSVTSIGDGAFFGCSGFTGSLTIPNSVTTIGNSAFGSCSGFTGSLTIPNSVTTIGYSAFYFCNGLTGSLTIPNSVTTIDYYAFYGCSGFTGSLTIPNSVTTIGSYAFYNCSGFTGNLTIPNSVITIGNYAFAGCNGLTGSLTIGNSVASIGNWAFQNCNGFYSITNFVETPPILGGGSFAGWNLNTPVFVPCGFEEVYSSLSWGGFRNYYEMCGGTVTVVANPVEGGMVTGGGTFETGQICTVMTTEYEGYSFSYWELNGKKISSDAEYSFYVAGDMTLVAHFLSEENIVFADAIVKDICVSHWDTNGDGELSYVEAALVTDLNNYFIGNTEITSFEELQYFIGLASISGNAFSNCSGLMGNLIIPSFVTTIGDYAFYNCSGLTGSLTIPNSVTTIGDGAFMDCSGFTGNLTIGNSVTTISYGAFYGCSGFTGDLTIPNSVTTIGYSAFCNCSGLTGSLTIPNSVTSIGYQAFSGCSGLNEAMLYNYNPPSLGSYAFSNTSFPIYVPYKSLNDYKTATNWSNYEDRIFPMAYTTVAGYGEGEGNYRFIASPLVENTAPTAVDNMITETPYDLYRFDQSENAEWQNYKYPENTPNFFLTNGQGYLYANAEDVNLIFKGAFNEDDTKEVGLAYDATATFAGWNLVGNPFPVSAYANKSYYTMNEDGTAIEPNTVSSATAIPACTGVMVMAEAEGETVVFSTEAPEATTNQGCLQIELSQAVELVETPTRKQDGPSTGSGTLHDKAIVSFNAGDRLEKFVFNKENAVISIPQGGKELAIACSDKQGEMPLNFKASKNGEYTLTINPEAVELDYLHLIDNLTGADVDLLALRQAQGPANYTFEAKTTDYASRFRLVFSGKEAGDPSTGSETFAFVNNGNIIITGADAGATLQIVDMTGRVVVSCGGHTRCVPTTGMAKGVYVLRLINGDDVKTQKIVIR